MLTHGNMTSYTYLEKQAKKYRDKPFLYYEDQVISYQKMFERTNQTAAWLEEKGIKKGDVVTVMIKNCPTFYDMWFACGALGAVLLPVNTASTPSELEYFLEHSESKGIIFDEDLITDDHRGIMRACNLLFERELAEDWLNEKSGKSEQRHDNEVNALDVTEIGRAHV